MKPASEWLHEVGESVLMYECAGSETENLIRRIQADALEHAAQLLTANADSQARGFNAVYREMLKLRNPS